MQLFVGIQGASFGYWLGRKKLREVGRRERRYLLRTNLAESDPARLWGVLPAVGRGRRGIQNPRVGGSISSLSVFVSGFGNPLNFGGQETRLTARARDRKGGTMETSAKSSPNAWRAESRVCLARRRNNFTSKAKTVPEI
jgi:hypothetical protein